MVTASASTPITATAINQVSHSPPLKPNKRPSRQMCADMTLTPWPPTASPRDTLGSTTLFWRPELRGHPPPGQEYTRIAYLSVSYVTGRMDSAFSAFGRGPRIKAEPSFPAALGLQGQHAVDHGTGKPEVVLGIRKPCQLGFRQMPGNLRILG